MGPSAVDGVNTLIADKAQFLKCLKCGEVLEVKGLPE
jgi:hypothetical protein